MKFRATKKGFIKSRIYPGDVFDAPDTFKSSWAVPVEEKKPDKPAPVSRKKKKSKKSD